MTAPDENRPAGAPVPGARPLRLPSKLDPRAHQPHTLHGDACSWVEKNCYIDIWIELTHALGLQPLAMMGVAATLDFLGDQWTFLKPSHDDLRTMYGIEVQELNIWRPLADHVREHLMAGRLVSVEADAWWLPDTAATDYRQRHTKTTILILRDEPAAERLTYLHNAGLYRLEGEDYRQTLANGGLAMPLFGEWVDFRRGAMREEDALRRLALDRLKQHLAWRPQDNPVRRFEARFAQDLTVLQGAVDRDRALADYHGWAFATTRQFGASMELLAWHLRWLGLSDTAADAFAGCSQAAKALILKGARAVVAGRALDAQALFATMADGWAQGMAELDRSV